jgi:hypothetical protein
MTILQSGSEHAATDPTRLSATPSLSGHARRRCVEMAISTKVPKRIVQDPCRVSYPGGRGSDRLIIFSPSEPRFAVVVSANESRWTIVTVLFRTEHRYIRNGATFDPD